MQTSTTSPVTERTDLRTFPLVFLFLGLNCEAWIKCLHLLIYPNPTISGFYFCIFFFLFNVILFRSSEICNAENRTCIFHVDMRSRNKMIPQPEKKAGNGRHSTTPTDRSTSRRLLRHLNSRQHCSHSRWADMIKSS